MRVLPILLAALAAPAETTFPRGQTIAQVSCLGDPSISYALYLPRGYREDRTWPVLFGFSPAGVGRQPVELFKAAAEQLGFILVGCNGARNGPSGPILKVQAAVWADLVQRFPLAPRRAYAAGFSGGARMAMRMADDHPEAFAGVISFGAFSPSRNPDPLRSMGWVLACGEEDYNHWEVRDGVESLRKRSARVFATDHRGGHRWPLARTCTESLVFLQLLAMDRNLVAEDPGLRADFLARGRAAAEAAEAEAEPLRALRLWENLAAGFPASAEGRLAAARIAVLEKLPAVKAELKLEASFRARRYGGLSLRGSDDPVGALNRMRERLRQAPPAEARNLRRLLNGEAARYFEAALQAMEGKAWDRAARDLESQAALSDREPLPCLYLAAVHCQQGRPDQAMQDLREACRRGHRSTPPLREWNLLACLRDRPDFQRLLAELDTAPAGDGSTR